MDHVLDTMLGDEKRPTTELSREEQWHHAAAAVDNRCNRCEKENANVDAASGVCWTEKETIICMKWGDGSIERYSPEPVGCFSWPNYAGEVPNGGYAEATRSSGFFWNHLGTGPIQVKVYKEGERIGEPREIDRTLIIDQRDNKPEPKHPKKYIYLGKARAALTK
ncbi:MAG: hypothetical protein PHW76_04140 [Alphaproteobacteria bacterium]|nr:hypothetical protein [Alphaproteobacteria bacterium]